MMSQNFNNKQVKIKIVSIKKGDVFSLLILVFILNIQIGNAFASEVVDELAFNKIPKLILGNNAKLKLSIIDYRISKQEQIAALFPLDPQLALSIFNETKNEKQNSSLENDTVEESVFGTSVGVTKKYKYGTELDISAQSLNNKSNSLNVIADSWNQTAAQILIKQPLLKNRAVESNLSEFLLAPIKTKRYFQKLLSTFEREVNKGEIAFYDVYVLNQKITLAIGNIKSFKSLYSYYRLGKKLGNKGLVKNAEVLVLLLREQAFLEKTRNEKIAALLKLSKILGVSISSIGKIPKDKREIESYSLESTSKIQELDYKIKEAKINYMKSKNQALPTLNLSFEYLSPGLSSSFGDSFEIVADNTFPNYTFTLDLVWKFGDYSGEGFVQQQSAKLRTIQMQRKKELVQLEFEILESKNKILKENENKYLIARSEVLIGQKVKIKKKLYRSGIISILELEDMFKEARKSRLGRVESIREHLENQSQLHYITGAYINNNKHEKEIQNLIERELWP